MAKQERFVVHSEGEGGKRTTELLADDKDEARFIVESQNRDAAKSDSSPESSPYKIIRVESA
jgi:hypothetical protein